MCRRGQSFDALAQHGMILCMQGAAAQVCIRLQRCGQREEAAATRDGSLTQRPLQPLLQRGVDQRDAWSCGYIPDPLLCYPALVKCLELVLRPPVLQQ